MAIIDAIEVSKLDLPQFDAREILEKLNKKFHTCLTPENGIYGVTETVKDNGVIERTGKNEFNHTFKEYLTEDGHLFKRRENFGNHNNATTYFDDNETAYLREVTQLKDNKARTVSQRLTPNTTIVKGNFSVITDEFGRPISNKITDLNINNSPRSSAAKFRNSAYRADDDIGHLIAHSLGGPESAENVVPQLNTVNRSMFKRVENEVRSLKEAGHTVDYEVRTNYANPKDMRPSSFEPKITVDGKEYTELPKELRKIYNDPDITPVGKIKTTISETCSTAHELGKKNGLVAAGLTLTISTVDNVSSYVDGEITAEEMVEDIVTETVVSGAVAYGTGFVSAAVSHAMSHSGSQLIQKIGGSCAASAVVAFGVDSYDSISAFARGEIDGSELAYDLGESAATVAGSFGGGAALGAAAGSVAGPAGTAVGGIVGGVVGCVVASEVYETAVEYGSEGVEMIGEKVEELANQTADFFKDTVPEKMEDAKLAFNDFFAENNLPFHI